MAWRRASSSERRRSLATRMSSWLASADDRAETGGAANAGAEDGAGFLGVVGVVAVGVVGVVSVIVVTVVAVVNCVAGLVTLVTLVDLG